MGDAVVAALVTDVLQRLTSEVIKELALLWGLKDDISTLKDDFDRIQAVLQDAEEKHIKEKAVELWLKRLRSASLEAENLLDEISTEHLLQRLHKEMGMKYKVRAFFSSNHNQLLFRVRIAHKLRAIRKKLDVISSKRFELNLTPSPDISHEDLGLESHMPDRETTSLIHSSLIFGRNEEMEMVTKMVCDNEIGKYDNGEILVYGIWGMGGVGKTTLAQLVYNHKRVNESFEFKCWVYVSENFQVRRIMQKIIESIDKCECKLTQLETLQDSFKNKLRGKKFLVVLDDVWIEDNERTKWDVLSKTLSCGAEGSIVVMTTRSQTTSRMMAKVPTLQHKLGCLSEEDSWLLFKKFAFAQGREGSDVSELEPIGREIVEKCKGLPLAVKTLGSLMWSKSSVIDWQRVKDNNIWELKESNVLPALKLSYDNLLPHLKRCFAYCCMFPKGSELDKDQMILLWLSNGFIPHKEEIDLHVLGEEIFNCLVWRSFFIVEVDKFLRERYIMHDLMHDLARHVMRDECLIIDSYKEIIIPSEVLHLVKQSRKEFSSEDLVKLTSLRSIFTTVDTKECSQLFSYVYLRVLRLSNFNYTTVSKSLCKLKYLRYLNIRYSRIRFLPESVMYLQNLQVLVLSDCELLYQLPESIGKLVNLIYLNVSKSCMENLPESLSSLQNLQVLILSFCRYLCKLPEGLRYMRKLQRLDIYDCISLYHLPSGVKELIRLKTLPRFPVYDEYGAKIGELGDLNLLEGKLKISGLKYVRDLNEAKSANLNSKTNIMFLGLIWWPARTRINETNTFECNEEVLEGLEPNPCLKGLKIIGYGGKIVSPSWIVNLRNLVKISFRGCGECEHIPTLGRLPNLKVIKLNYMKSFKCFHESDTNMLGDTTNMFLSLQELNINMCPNLVSLPSNLPKLEVLKLKGFYDELVSFPGNLPKLEVLELQWCSKLVSLTGNFPKLKVLDIAMCLELASLPSNLPNIRKLRLVSCPKLLSLPDEIQSFKDLNQLDISGSDHLMERYRKTYGIDWPKISHIPNIRAAR